jgi:hypothetical protein
MTGCARRTVGGRGDSRIMDRRTGTEHRGGCHCGNLRLTLLLSTPPEAVRLRACQCSFCRAHATRTTSDSNGAVEVWAEDWSLVKPYRFGTGTAEFLICRRCGVYIGAFCDTQDEPRRHKHERTRGQGPVRRRADPS